MSTLREGLPPLPLKMRHLPIDKRGFPVPYFVARINGEPDHRVVEPRAMDACIKHGRCWICGLPLARELAFCIGPMCGVTRTNSEPPSHEECAAYAASACPFLSRPHAHRRDAGLPDKPLRMPAGHMIERNPGCVCVWITGKVRAYSAQYGQPGVLFQMGAPLRTRWFSQGRPATLEEVTLSIDSGVPLLLDLCESATDALLVGEQVAALKRIVERDIRPEAANA